jgi:hypothetical protein
MAEPRELRPVTFFDGDGPVVTKNFSATPERVDPVEEALQAHPAGNPGPVPPDSEPYPTPATPTPHPDGPLPMDVTEADAGTPAPADYPDDLIPS